MFNPGERRPPSKPSTVYTTVLPHFIHYRLAKTPLSQSVQVCQNIITQIVVN